MLRGAGRVRGRREKNFVPFPGAGGGDPTTCQVSFLLGMSLTLNGILGERNMYYLLATVDHHGLKL